MSHACQEVEAMGGHAMDMGRGVRAGRAERAGMHWGPFKSSDRGMGPRGHGKGAWRGRVCGWWQPCETWGHELEPLKKECQNEGMGPCDGTGGAGGVAERAARLGP